MRVAIINPQWINDGRHTGIRSGSRWPHVRTDFFSIYPFPFQLAYASSLLRNEGHEVLLLDAIALDIDTDSLMAKLADFAPQLVFHETTSPTFDYDVAVIRRLHERLGCKVVSGGQLATSFPDKILDYADFAIAGESERALAQLCGALERGAPYAEIPGLSFIHDGKLTRNPPELISDLDALPWPERDPAAVKRYQENFCAHYPNATVISSRGCPFRCSFCLESFVFNHKPNHRTRSVENVVDEMAYLRDTFGVKEIYFDDTSFTVNRNRVRRICQELIDRNLRIHWSCMADAKIDGETLAMMKRSGCTGIKIGVETTNPATLESVNKPIANKEVLACVENCRKLDIFLHGTFIIGLPEETEESITRTIDFAFSHGFDWMQFSPAIPYPGTPFYERSKQEGWLISEDWDKRVVHGNVNLTYPQLGSAEIERHLSRARRLLNRRMFTRWRLLNRYLRLAWYLKDFSLLTMILRRLKTVFR